jgi:hypothetical protein
LDTKETKQNLSAADTYKFGHSWLSPKGTLAKVALEALTDHPLAASAWEQRGLASLKVGRQPSLGRFNLFTTDH